jgi:hypothetical protein
MTAPPLTIEKTIECLREAANANRKTVARQGNVIRLDQTNAEDVLVAADLHGNRLNFARLLRRADLANHPRRHLVMQEVCHGGPTYPNGGCMSHLLLEDVAALKVQYPERFHFIISNHELAELTDFPIMKASRMLNLVFRTGVQELYGDRAEQVRQAYLNFLKACPLAVALASRIFICHSAPEKLRYEEFDSNVFDRALETSDYAPRGPVFRLVWGRDFSQENAEAFAKLVDADILLHGHEPCPGGFQVPNSKQIILDCCGDQGRYLIVPASGNVSQEELIERIERI